MVDPLVLQMASTRAFCSFAWRSAIRVSMVSPDWEIATTSVERSSTGSRYRNSLASSTSHGIRVQCSIAYLATMPGVVRGTARDDEDLVDVAQVLVGQAHLVEQDVAALGEPAQQGVGDRLRLLGDLLEHEVVVAALLGGGGVPVDVEVACRWPGCRRSR